MTRSVIGATMMLSAAFFLWADSVEAAAESSPAPSSKAVVIDAEFLAASQGRNVAQVPNDASGTRFAIDDLTGQGPYFLPRVQIAWQAGERSEWRVLLAPLSLSGDGVSTRPVSFQGKSFAAGPVSARYEFNSWRATWRWRWIDRDDLVVKVGFTAKIRDASIALRQGTISAQKDNTGFVPLLHGSFERPIGAAWSVEGDIDALAGGPGYAVDAGLRLSREISPQWRVAASLRFLDGGADNDEVYAFARFTSVGIAIRWQSR